MGRRQRKGVLRRECLALWKKGKDQGRWDGGESKLGALREQNCRKKH